MSTGAQDGGPAIGAYPPSGAEDAPVELARHWLRMERPQRALEELGRLRGDSALSVDAYLLRAAALHDLDRHAEACEAALSGLGRLGPNPSLLSILGDSRRLLGQYEEAEQAFLEGLAADPAHVYLLCRYARLCLDVAQFGKAERLVDRAASCRPHAGIVVRTRVLVAYASGRDGEAVRHSREALAHDPDDAAGHALHGLAAEASGDLRAAYRSLRRAAAARPGNTELVRAARRARVVAHPLLWPLRLIARFGPIQVWLAAVAIMWLLQATGHGAAGLGFAVAWVTYCVYSWVAPPLVRKLVGRGR
jgi:tetratricopeptide (TPR) repeat protein